jgi:hypothetical protein
MAVGECSTSLEPEHHTVKTLPSMIKTDHRNLREARRYPPTASLNSRCRSLFICLGAAGVGSGAP